MDTRAALLDSAENLTRRRGFDGFSFAHLSDEVGIAKPTIHHYFRTKADLALAVIERYRDRFFAELEAIHDQDGPAGVQLSRFLDYYQMSMEDGRSVCLFVVLSAGREGLSARVIDELNHCHDRSLVWLEGVFERAITDKSIQCVEDPKREAAACLSLLEGAHLVARAAEDGIRFEMALKLLRNRIV